MDEDLEGVPQEIQDFLDEALGFVELSDINSKLEYSLVAPEKGKEEDQEWFLRIYIVPVEVYKGEHDGEKISSAFKVRVDDVLKLFDQNENGPSATFDSGHSDVGAHLELMGDVKGQLLILQYLLHAPDDTEHDGQIDLETGKRE